MPDLHQFDKQDLINLQKVMDIDVSDSAAYEIDGKIKSMYQRGEKGYRIQMKNDDKIFLFIFSKYNKLIAQSVQLDTSKAPEF